MDIYHHLVNELEEQLFTAVDARSVDLTCDGLITLERMSSPNSDEDGLLIYFIHSKNQGATTNEGVSIGQVTLKSVGHHLEVQAELNIKKFIKPQLSLSSAHIAVLIHSLKGLVKRLQIKTIEGSPLSWKLDRVQRRVKLEDHVYLSLESAVWLLRQVTRMINKLNALSLEIIQEEAEYYRAIERWSHARRAYLTWFNVSHMRYENLQDTLGVFQQLKDWRGCLSLLESSIQHYEPHLGAKLAYAAGVLCRDVLSEKDHAQSLFQQAIELDPDNQVFQNAVLPKSKKTEPQDEPKAQLNEPQDEPEAQLNEPQDEPEAQLNEPQDEPDVLINPTTEDISSVTTQPQVNRSTRSQPNKKHNKKSKKRAKKKSSKRR